MVGSDMLCRGMVGWVRLRSGEMRYGMVSSLYYGKGSQGLSKVRCGTVGLGEVRSGPASCVSFRCGPVRHGMVGFGHFSSAMVR